MLRRSHSPAVDKDQGLPFASRPDLLALLVFIVLAIAITFSVSRPNEDDAYYMNAVASAIDHSDLPLLSFDGMHDDLSKPIHLVAHKRQTYELLVAALAEFSGQAAWKFYYVYLPLLFAAFIGIANWLLLKRWLHGRAHIALLALLAVLVLWNAGGRSYGLWSLTMLYPGKIVMLAVLIPLIVHYSLVLLDKGGARALVLLLLAQSAAICLSSSGVYIAPLTTGLVYLACFRPDNFSWSKLLYILLALLPACFALLLTWLELRAVGGFGSQGKPFDPIVLFGNNPRGYSAFIALLMVPFFMRQSTFPASAFMLRYLAISLLIIFNPLVISALEMFAKLLTWRTMWAVPAPAILAVGVVAVWDGGLKLRHVDNRLVSGLPYAVFALLMMVFVFSGPTTLNDKGSFITLGQPKVRQHSYAAARAVFNAVEQDDLVLAPTFISVPLAGMNKAPSLVIVKPLYIDHMRHHWPDGEGESRKALQAFTEKGADNPDDWEWVIGQIVSRDISVVVLVSETTAHEQDFRAALIENGFEPKTSGAFEIWSLKGR
jgi:hypothetical protein